MPPSHEEFETQVREFEEIIKKCKIFMTKYDESIESLVRGIEREVRV